MRFQPIIEYSQPEKLADLQLERLKETLRHIERNNPFYFRHLKGAKNIKSLEDIKIFPFLTKDHLRKNYPFNLSCAPKEKIYRIHLSSGTTGTTIINPMTYKDIQQWAEIVARCFTMAGLTKKDILQITPSFGLFNGGFGFHYGAEKLGIMVIPTGPGRSQLQLKFINDLGVTALAAIASYPLRLIEIAKEVDFDFRKTKLKIGIFGAEVWSNEMRRKIEENMNIETFDILGLTESGGVGLGLDCKYHQGIHVWEDHYFIEIIDPKTGKQLPDGQEGEMVITTLTREGLPLVRYRTGDITAIVSRKPCQCGSSMLRVDRIKGRTDDMIVIKGVNFYPSQIESLIMSTKGAYGQYQIKLTKMEGKDQILLLIEYEGKNMDKFKESLQEKIYNFLGFHIELKILPVGSLPRSKGKFMRVIDERRT
jgi:phenylacetate-CoA ligase